MITYLNTSNIIRHPLSHTVTGFVLFPEPASHGDRIKVDYRSIQQPFTSKPPIIGDQPARLSPKENKKKNVVNRFNELLTEYPDTSKSSMFEQVAKQFQCSKRSVQKWVSDFEKHGVDGLLDNYKPAPKSLPRFDKFHAEEAIKLLTWWAYRIGNLNAIDTYHMQIAVKLFENGYELKNLIPVIEYYFDYDTDRIRFPFLPFSRWALHEIDKWITRAANRADQHRARQDTIDRKRKTARTRSQISSNQNIHHEHSRNVGKTADMMKSLGMGKTAGHVIQASAPGATPHVLKQPQTLAESLAAMDDTYRTMLIQASQGDRVQADKATATLPIWWEKLPQSEQQLIDGRVQKWVEENSVKDLKKINHRKLQILLPKLRNGKSGAQKLFTSLM